MTSQAKKTTWRNSTLKIVSLLLGYTFWYMFGHSHTSTAWVTVPICFYNVPAEARIRAPESISIKIMGKRSDLRALDIEQLALHIDTRELEVGKNRLPLNESLFFLPDSIKLLNYSPSNPTVELVSNTRVQATDS